MMSREDFKKLAEGTYSFTQLNKEEKERILHLDGEERESYVGIFEDERRVLAKAYDDFKKETSQIVSDFTEVVKKEKNSKRFAKEAAGKKVDEQLLQNLLKKI